MQGLWHVSTHHRWRCSVHSPTGNSVSISWILFQEKDSPENTWRKSSGNTNFSPSTKKNSNPPSTSTIRKKEIICKMIWKLRRKMSKRKTHRNNWKTEKMCMEELRKIQWNDMSKIFVEYGHPILFLKLYFSLKMYQTEMKKELKAYCCQWNRNGVTGSMLNENIVSLLIPCYNGEQFVERCLINVLEQDMHNI